MDTASQRQKHSGLYLHPFHRRTLCRDDTTTLILVQPLSPQQVHDVIVNNLESFHPVDLESSDYLEIIRNVARLKITGGGIYDAIIAQAALKANVDVLLTMNSKHFTRLGEHISRLVRDPSV